MCHLVIGFIRRTSLHCHMPQKHLFLGNFQLTCACISHCLSMLAWQYIDDHVRDRELTMHALEDIPHTLVPLSKLELPPGELRTLYVVLVVDGQSHADLQGRLQNLEAKVGMFCPY